ncbi:MAG: hypothetical protein KGM99_12250, partial [Burkholderiales bacterium]|nr:hypothetical protein [Burkholderiales bacterium]
MQYLGYPIYGAGKLGLSAHYTISFASDLSALVPLNGSFQGDPVQPRSVYIDNYNNQYSVNYTLNGETGIIPAFSIGYIDVEKQTQITFETQASQVVSLYLLTAKNPTGFNSRGLPPPGTTNDPQYSKVLGLWNCNGVNGVAITQDSKAGNYLNGNAQVPSGWLIDTSNSKFG